MPGLGRRPPTMAIAANVVAKQESLATAIPRLGGRRPQSSGHTRRRILTLVSSFAPPGGSAAPPCMPTRR